jgi:hypothetical protein
MWRTRPGARAPPYPPHIWVGYEGCQSARVYEARLRGLSGSKNRDQSVTGRVAQAFEAGLGCPAVDATSVAFLSLTSPTLTHTLSQNPTQNIHRNAMKSGTAIKLK